MPRHLTGPQWVDQFLNRFSVLSSLTTSVTPSDATALALSVYPARKGMAPEEAADLCALELRLDEVCEQND